MKIAQEQGPNACVVEEVPGTKHRYYTDCKYWRNREICGQKTVIRYECCEGFQQVPGQQGCTGVKPLKNVLETARDLGASKFVRYLETSGLAPELTRAGAITLFAPLDEAFDELAREQRLRLENAPNPAQNPFLLYHVSDRKLTSQHFRADFSIETRYNGHQLRINKYSNGMSTVNCASIVRKDQEASNGVVHILDSVLDPAFTVERDLAELIMQDGRFTELAKAIEQSGFVSKLRQTHQPCTILAPSDEAFQKIPSSRMQRILADKKAREALLQNHVIPHPMCLAAILGEHKVRTTGSGRLTFDCDRKGVTVEGKRLRSDFIMGQNGVLYMVDDLLLPDRAKSIVQLAEEEKLFSFMEMVTTAGLDDAFENFSEYTLFVPSEAAMYSLPPTTLQELRTNKEKARQFVMFHATQGRITSDQITDNQVVMSLDENHPLRLQVYRRALGVEDAIIEKSDIEGMNGCIHVINKALTPANVSAGEVLRQDGNFSIFLQAMERVMESSPEKLELRKDGAFTFFVPTDQAFTRLGSQRLERIMDDTTYLAKTIRNHVVDDMLASEAFKPDLYYDIQTRQNTVDVVRKNGKLKVNDATMLTCDILNTNGVIHVINKVLLPDQHLED
ncbi:transforming growth factor-beta-induced protein ig-h3 [Anabrus simplex]|uniref:transforming growth factor-beta-induced protein ig-h3 n=1 Tax=Anabrus simplex TaxID=316456 RepID=UPI0034DDBA6E